MTTTPHADERDADVVVVGAGASGVGVARLLVAGGLRVVVLERDGAPGSAWRRRYERLRLHTTRRWSHVAGTRLEHRDRFVPALGYAQHVVDAGSDIDVRIRHEVTSIAEADGGLLCVMVAGGQLLHARHVVLATGQNDVPVEPALPGRSAFPGVVLHVDAYRSGSEFTGQRVLVVGAGNSGTEVAQDLAEHGAAAVGLAIRSVPRIVPRSFGPLPSHAVAVALARVAGVSGMRRATRAAATIGGRTRLARLGLYPPSERHAAGVPTMDHGFVDLVARGHVQVLPALQDLEAHGAVLVDASTWACDAVVLATGYRPAAFGLLDEALRRDATPETLHDPSALGGRGVWAVGFGPAPLGQLLLARDHARTVATMLLRQR